MQNFEDTFTCFQLVKANWNAFLDYVILEKHCFRDLFLNLVLAGWFRIIHANSILGELKQYQPASLDQIAFCVSQSTAE